MKKRIAALAMALAMVMGIAAVAAGSEKNITVTPMKMTINGQEVTPTKSDGTAAEVFAYDGATYVPLRYLSELLGVQVDWDANDNTTAKLVMDKMTYIGTGVGYGGPGSPIEAEVVLTADKKIDSVKVTASGETASIGGMAVKPLTEKILAAQSTKVDAISGATLTSFGILNAVNSALKSAGVDPSSLTPVEVEDNTPDTMDVDVVVVGAGGAGMTAAITAAQAGKKVVILEKLGIPGGNTSRSTGGMNAVSDWRNANEWDAGGEANALEATFKAAEEYPDLAKLTATVKKEYEDWKKAGSKGYFDSVNLMILDTMIGGHGINNPDLVQVLAENSADGIAFIDSIGGTLHDVGKFAGATVKRIHRPVNAAGKTVSVGTYLVPVLAQACEDNGVEIIYNTTVNEIVTKNNKAVGVKAENGLTVNAKSVILATGGFGGDLEMVAQYDPSLEGFITTNARSCTGDGIKMATAIGAATVDMEHIQIHPTVEQTTSSLITEGLRGDGAILVNQEGVRFCDDTAARDVVSAAELKQTGGYAYLIVDQKMVDASTVIQGYLKKGWAKEGATYAELAEATGMPADAFTATMEKWNKNVADKSDPDFGRTGFANPLDTAPYYAIKVAPGIHHTMGGVKINTSAQVLNEKDKVISGLYAAGEVTGGVHGANRLGGNAVCDIVVFGRIAGENAAKAAK